VFILGGIGNEKVLYFISCNNDYYTSLMSSTIQISAESDTYDTNDDWLHVEGNNIVDKYGNKVWLTGANWFGFNCRERMLLDSYHSNIVKDIEMVADKGINVVRIPIATDLFRCLEQRRIPCFNDYKAIITKL
jgi:aryl-phospho-beta-D-glucosidase BglC (GH1 family)